MDLLLGAGVRADDPYPAVLGRLHGHCGGKGPGFTGNVIENDELSRPQNLPAGNEGPGTMGLLHDVPCDVVFGLCGRRVH